MNRRHTILLVDDEATNLQLLRGILGDEYDLVFARSGASALELAAAFPQPDLILLDIMLPDLDGYGVCQRLKAEARTSAIPVIFVTVRTSEADETRGLDLGAVDYLTKPVNGPIVRARVRTHLALRQAQRELERRNAELKEAALQREVVDQILRHDLKSPLNAIVAAPEILLHELQLSSHQEKLLRMVAESGYLLLEQINRTLDLYKMERGNYVYEPVAVDLVELLEGIRLEIVDALRQRCLRFEVRMGERVLERAGEQRFMVAGDSLLLRAMLSNLIRNAVEAASVEGVVEVSLERLSPWNVIGICNPGEVAAEIRDRFFDKFSTFGKKRGTGLGTYSARLIALTLGGAIRLDLSRPGWTRVETVLPMHDLDRVVARGAVGVKE
ncbi:MAG: hybrid sensor histidine kinase/response regulator [Magnetococcales bacterium]|nr:hybrid sensor histidine kinase/response regulator [Magnetococcales bacterium]